MEKEKEKEKLKVQKKKIINQANSQGKWEMREAESWVKNLELEECEIMFIVRFKRKH